MPNPFQVILFCESPKIWKNRKWDKCVLIYWRCWIKVWNLGFYDNLRKSGVSGPTASFLKPARGVRKRVMIWGQTLKGLWSSKNSNKQSGHQTNTENWGGPQDKNIWSWALGHPPGPWWWSLMSPSPPVDVGGCGCPGPENVRERERTKRSRASSTNSERFVIIIKNPTMQVAINLLNIPQHVVKFANCLSSVRDSHMRAPTMLQWGSTEGPVGSH